MRDWTFHSLYVEESGRELWVDTLSSRLTDCRRFERTWYLIIQGSRTIIGSLGATMRGLGKRECDWSSVTSLKKIMCLYPYLRALFTQSAFFDNRSVRYK